MSKQVKKPAAISRANTLKSDLSGTEGSTSTVVVNATPTTTPTSTDNTTPAINVISNAPPRVDIKPPSMLDLITQVANAYTAAGWNIIIVYPIKSMVDIIAKKTISGETGTRWRFHFIQVVPYEGRDVGKFIGQQKNDFIQNALSNQADPIHAMVTTELKRGEYKFKLSIGNPNTNAAVRL